MSIKKVFAPIVALLESAVEANSKVKVTEVLAKVLDLCAAKTGGSTGTSTSVRNDEGVVVAIKCYYHQTWMDPRVVEFGAKATSTTGLNNMCKEGVRKWTRQQTAAKKAELELLARVQSGDLAISDIAAEQERIAAERAAIIPREDGYGFDSVEECIADSASRGL